MKTLKLLILIGFSLCMFSCSDDDTTTSLKDTNPIYFSFGESLELDDELEIENIQISFDHVSNKLRVVSQLKTDIEGSGNVSVVFDATLNLTSSSKSDDYKYTIQADSGATYSQSLQLAAGCLNLTPDPGFGAGIVQEDIVYENFVQWDDSAAKYYISTSELIIFMLGLVDPGFTLPPGVDPGFGQYPKIWQTSGSIKGCSELPTLFN
ncbi:hypothetical protein [Flammeovirga aprica]|uniref:Uncharacterized protein n=1 Tax=Flammeovirga aprica JL-4 TaxID=694437 RepID=A0A7X9RYZ8_9BACT|nr:hypothetical protein [Flammeovirga aprica]NME71387.1 hypothetical protein [Flammeovirga aprica JL-4]